MTIAIICPTRGRPKMFERMVQSAHATADRKNIRIYFYTAEADSEHGNYKAPEGCTHFTGLDLSCVAACNYLAAHPVVKENSLLMVAADDTIFTTPGWDVALLEAYEKLDNKIHVFSLLDSRDENGTPHPIVTQEYCEAMGYFFPPIFLHWYADTWTVQIAKANNCFTHLKDYMLAHDKITDRGETDETYSRIRRMGWHVMDSQVNDKCKHFLELEKLRLQRSINGIMGFIHSDLLLKLFPAYEKKS